MMINVSRNCAKNDPNIKNRITTDPYVYQMLPALLIVKFTDGPEF